MVDATPRLRASAGGTRSRTWRAPRCRLRLAVARTLQHALAVAPDDLHRSRVSGLALGLFSVAVMSATLGLLTFSMTYLMLGLALAVTDQAHDDDAARPPSQASAAQSMLSAVRVPREHTR